MFFAEASCIFNNHLHNSHKLLPSSALIFHIYFGQVLEGGNDSDEEDGSCGVGNKIMTMSGSDDDGGGD